VLREHFCLAVAFASAVPHYRSCDAGVKHLCQQGSNADASQLVPVLCKHEEPKKAFAPPATQKQWEFARQELTRRLSEQVTSCVSISGMSDLFPTCVLTPRKITFVPPRDSPIWVSGFF
jgi:hypothetical protein